LGWLSPSPELRNQRREKLAAIVARGKKSFVWRRGVFGSGLTGFLLISASNCWRRYHDHNLDSRFLTFGLAFSLLACLVVGYFVGIVLWKQLNSALKSSE
jgi:hypothetical protein